LKDSDDNARSSGRHKDIMTNEFRGLTAVVTGGASGIGASVVARLISSGARVGILDLNIDGANPAAVSAVADVSDDESVRAGVSSLVAELGGIDILINNAGIGSQGTVEDNDDDEWARVLSINVTGIARVSRASLPYLRLSKSAAIVNTCSIAATAGLPARALYSASKGAVLALTRAMAADHLHEGIRVNCVNPGTADTPWVGRLLASADDPAAERAALNARQPHGRLVDPGEIAEAIAYLASPLNRSTTGTSLAVDGGMQELRLRPVE
jgi:NAD(P)-dependent dehydrogenase (short-subunit alcohol dehydrogenase family)